MGNEIQGNRERREVQIVREIGVALISGKKFERGKLSLRLVLGQRGRERERERTRKIMTSFRARRKTFIFWWPFDMSGKLDSVVL
jgi:hypothetical protein